MRPNDDAIREALHAHGLYDRALDSDWAEVRGWGETEIVCKRARCTPANLRNFIIDEVARRDTL